MAYAEHELIRLAQAGQALAFEELVRQHQTHAYNLAYRLLGSADDAADVAQEALVRAFQALPSFREGAKFGTWLYRIVHNACLDELRRRNRRLTLSLDAPRSEDDTATRDVPDPSPDPEELAQRSELRELLELALQGLPEEFRFPVVLRDLHGCNYEEIAEVLNLPLGTVKSRIHRGRLLLRDALQRAEPQAPENVETNKPARKGGVAR